MTDRRSKPSRYEVRTDVTSLTVAKKFPELAGKKLYRVWDSQTGKYVPFGNHSDRDGAQRHIDRLEDRDREQAEA